LFRTATFSVFTFDPSSFLYNSYGNAVKSVTGKNPAGLYDSTNSKLGQGKGLRQYYRFGLYSE